MICFQFRRRLNDHIAGRLAADARRECETHLAACGKCRSLHEAEKTLYERLSLAKPPAPPEGYWENFETRVRGRILEEQREADPKRWSFTDWRIAAAGAALVLAVWGGYRTGVRSVKGPSPVRLAGFDGGKGEVEPFHEILTLYAERINWISLIGDRLDFSVNVVSAGDLADLTPMALTLFRPDGELRMRWLVRPGQEATAQGQGWGQAEVTARLRTSPDGARAWIACRLRDQGDIGGLEATVDVRRENPINVGSLFWKGEPMSLTLQRLPKTLAQPGRGRVESNRQGRAKT